MLMCRPQQTSERGPVTKGPSWGVEEAAIPVTSYHLQTKAGEGVSAQIPWGEGLCGTPWVVTFAWVGVGVRRSGVENAPGEGHGANAAAPCPSGSSPLGGGDGGASPEGACPRCNSVGGSGLGASSGVGCVWRTHGAYSLEAGPQHLLPRPPHKVVALPQGYVGQTQLPPSTPTQCLLPRCTRSHS